MRTRRGLKGAVLCSALLGGLRGEAPAQEQQDPTYGVEILVTHGPGGAAHVEERYTMPASAAPLELRLLGRPCVEVRNLRAQRSGAEVSLRESREGPWTVLRDPTSEGDANNVTVRYDVRLLGSGSDIPLAHMPTPVPQEDGEREGTVELVVRLGDSSSVIAFPHMERTGPDVWRARYVAIPSFVAVSPGGADRAGGDCTPGSIPGDDGGLVWRFLLLAGIMAAWVPLYLAWARHTGEGAE